MKLRPPKYGFYFFSGILATSIYFSVNPAYAAGDLSLVQRCTATLDHLAKQTSSVLKLGALPTLETVFQIPSLDSTGSAHQIRFLPKDSWGDPQHLKGKNFIFSAAIKDKSDGLALLKQILKASGISTDEIEMAGDKMGMTIEGKLYAYFHQAERTPAIDDNILELRISMDNGATEETGKQFLDGLKKLGIFSVATDLVSFDLSTYSGRREWAYYSFYKWADGLSMEELRALRELAGPNYKEIHSALRRNEIDSRWQPVISHLDEAVSKGTIDRDITVWRASAQKELFDAWAQLNAKTSAQIELSKDPAFIFSSLDERIARWWNQSQLKNTGIIVEIHAPQGAHAVYIDAKGIEADRGYQEMVFGRNVSMIAKEAKVGTDGKPILVVELRP